MPNSTIRPELADALDCPFCGGNFFFFSQGAVACDQCQAEGPFAGCLFDGESSEKAEAVRLWNLRGSDDWCSVENAEASLDRLVGVGVAWKAPDGRYHLREDVECTFHDDGSATVKKARAQ